MRQLQQKPKTACLRDDQQAEADSSTAINCLRLSSRQPNASKGRAITYRELGFGRGVSDTKGTTAWQNELSLLGSSSRNTLYCPPPPLPPQKSTFAPDDSSKPVEDSKKPFDVVQAKCMAARLFHARFRSFIAAAAAISPANLLRLAKPFTWLRMTCMKNSSSHCA